MVDALEFQNLLNMPSLVFSSRNHSAIWRDLNFTMPKTLKMEIRTQLPSDSAYLWTYTVGTLGRKRPYTTVHRDSASTEATFDAKYFICVNALFFMRRALPQRGDQSFSK